MSWLSHLNLGVGWVRLSCCVRLCSVASGSLRPHGLWPADPSVLGTFQARILQWVAIFSSVALLCPLLNNPYAPFSPSWVPFPVIRSLLPRHRGEGVRIWGPVMICLLVSPVPYDTPHGLAHMCTHTYLTSVSAQHQGSLGPCWGPWEAHMTSLSSNFPVCSVTPQLHPLCLLSQAGLRLKKDNERAGLKRTSVCACSLAQLCPILCNPIDCSPPGSSVHGILQARILEWVAIPFLRGSS